MIKRKMKISNTVEEEVQRRKLFFYGHVRRMEENRMPKMGIQYQFTCKKKKKEENQEEYGLMKQRRQWKKVGQRKNRVQTGQDEEKPQLMEGDVRCQQQ